MNEFEEFNQLVNEYYSMLEEPELLEPQAKKFIGSGEDVSLEQDE